MLRPCGEAGQQRLAFACWVREPPWLSLGLFAAGKGGEIPIEGAIVKALESVGALTLEAGCSLGL